MRGEIFGFLFFIFLILPSCDQITKSTKYDHLDQRTKIRLKQYLVEGKRLYHLHCANCHQTEGTGLARLYPPLKHSDYLFSNRRESICGIRHGQKGEIFVNGVSFNQEMPSNSKLTKLEIAEIATYIYTEFTDSVQIVTIKEVQIILDSCKRDSM
jgi:cytochrome c551